MGLGCARRRPAAADRDPASGAAAAGAGFLNLPASALCGAARGSRENPAKPGRITMSDQRSAAPRAVAPRRINHIVLNVRDIEESHRFWTEIVGLKQVATLRPRPGVTLPKMRFYSDDHEGKYTHHDVALVESLNVPPPTDWMLSGGSVAVTRTA